MKKRINHILRGCASRIFRRQVVAAHKKRNNVKHCSVISSNCIGGILSHDLGLRFDSPTVNLWFEAKGFVKFLENFEHYIAIPFCNICFDQKRGYPVGELDEDIRIYFQHYHSVEEAAEAWKRRCKRVDLNNLCVICTDRDGMTRECCNDF